ncbi:putative Fe-Mo cluster-binding NifX family protein [Sporomusaceae bacterium BoRhaA]|uniref:NifB/NifX family molybdenum-iron cluster-binding protein n=1 Tax=Pelorhabdus rhamnosifermentans TaxID=2772457 RepID=UPI001C05FE00|nr:NifB/NifX family molybdenum-iron cluster-binding protein [Pelorhabdus rhamnosifermentans]MBU2701328.1 putative Fe-Mo cluster-binding NifX family protein [Pelorhabdus rhamnosifermentans]
MKIAFTSHGDDRHAAVDSRFGRADYFVLYDEENKTWDSLPNTQNVEAAHGAGIQAGQTLAKTGAKVLITGHVGPKAFKVLQAEQIAMYSLGEMNGTVEEALSAFLSDKLTAIAIPNALDLKK